MGILAEMSFHNILMIVRHFLRVLIVLTAADIHNGLSRDSVSGIYSTETRQVPGSNQYLEIQHTWNGQYREKNLIIAKIQLINPEKRQ